MKVASLCGASKHKPTETVETVTWKNAGKRLREQVTAKQTGLQEVVLGI
jgi:hypothetical protein